MIERVFDCGFPGCGKVLRLSAETAPRIHEMAEQMGWKTKEGVRCDKHKYQHPNAGYRRPLHQIGPLEGNEMSETTTYEKEIALYAEAILKCKEAGMPRNAAKETAKQAVYEKFGYLKSGQLTNEHPRFWSQVSNIVRELYPEKANPAVVLTHQTHQPQLLDKQKPETFMDAVREMAKTGFIPYGKYIEPLAGADKARQMSAYVSQVCKGIYTVEKNGVGWICTPIETPEQKIEREKEEERKATIASLNKQIAAMQNMLTELAKG